MTQDSEHTIVDGFMDVEDKPVAHGVASVICLPSTVGNVIFHVTCTTLHLIKIIEFFEGLAHEDANHPI